MPTRQVRIAFTVIVALTVIFSWFMYFTDAKYAALFGFEGPLVKTMVLLVLVVVEFQEQRKDDDSDGAMKM